VHPQNLGIMAKAVSLAALVCGAARGSDLPASFDLRHHGTVTEVRYQSGGTCWAHGTMAAIESNLLMTGRWAASGQTGLPNLAEYHLDWWNGFNGQSNSDWPGHGGLVVHEGGDYLVAAAYLSRGDGAVYHPSANDGQADTPWYARPPLRYDPRYAYYYVRDIEWHTAGWNLEHIDRIKQRIMTQGAMATCMAFDMRFMSGSVHYQPRGSAMLPNHSVAIVGWDDDKVTPAPQGLGAWLCKNSWGTGYFEDGYIWISYWDRWCCQEPDMGAVFFRDVEPMRYDRVYYHDLHGRRDTLTDCHEAFNAFWGQGRDTVEAVSFYTAVDGAAYTAVVYESFRQGRLSGELARASGTLAYRGFHTVELDRPVEVFPAEDFFVYVWLSQGGHAYDRTSEVPVLLGGPGWEPAQAMETSRGAFLGKTALEDGQSVLVVSAANPGESYYRTGEQWVDLHDLDGSANFCIKALATAREAVAGDFNRDGRVDERDLAVLAGAWLTQEGQEAYRRICDISQPDGEIIDMEDFAVFTRIWADLHIVPR